MCAPTWRQVLGGKRHKVLCHAEAMQSDADPLSSPAHHTHAPLLSQQVLGGKGHEGLPRSSAVYGVADPLMSAGGIGNTVTRTVGDKYKLCKRAIVHSLQVAPLRWVQPF